MEHLSNSKELFRTLVNRIALPESKDEIESLVFLLLEKRCKLKRAEILTGKMTDCAITDLMQYVERINTQEPIQYILGVADFFGREFVVDRSVLIPRPETETLVAEALQFMRSRQTGSTLDIGTGSGCIAISLALGSSFDVTALDVSYNALDIAKNNERRLKAHVRFLQHDFLGERKLPGSWDLIVSNPPYVRKSEESQIKSNVKDHEPHLALFVPDDDPLIFYKAIANYGLEALKSDGQILVELNEFLADETRDLFAGLGYECVLLKDLSNKNRVLKASRRLFPA